MGSQNILSQLKRLQSFLQVGNVKANQGVDRQTYNKMKRNKKVDLEFLHQQEFEKDAADEVDPKNCKRNICPSLIRQKTPGRDISFKKLRYNINQVSPTVSDRLEYQDRVITELKTKLVTHMVDRYIPHTDFIKKLDQLKHQ